MSNTSSNKTSKTNKRTVKVIVGEIGRDTKTGILGRGYSYDNGATFHVTDTMFGRLYDKDDGERMWPNMAHKVADEIKSATADLPNVRKQADEAVKFAESAIAASKVNSDAIVAQSSAVIEAKSTMDSATAEIQQTAANAASDAAKIRADVAQVQSEVDTAKAANSASVEALKSDVSAAKQDLADVHDSLTKAQSAIEQNQKLINDSVTKITSDVSATKQDLANVHDSLTKAQAAAEQNQKAIDDSIAQINANVDATNQDLVGVRKDLAKAQSDIAANQKSINDNVAKINADITQDRKDIASAQQANTDTAKQLDTYSKQAVEQGKTIKTIQDKQDGFTATLADVQGNVTQVSDKVDGLSASLKDAQDNVASVKAQADQLSATLTDHANSIATLTASAKELSSTLEDADGRLSKVEQTAQTNSSTLSDLQGDLSQVKQGATTLTATLKDAQGNISTLQQKADSVSTQLASAQGDIATLQTGVDGVKATLASHDKTIHTLQLDSKSLKDSMADAQGDISTLQKSATSLDSEMKDHAGRLSKVEQSAATQATTLSDLQGNLTQVKQQADGLVTTLKSAQGDITQIQQKADGTLAQLKSAQGDIASLQTDVTGIKATLTSHEGDIHTLQADSKSLKDDMQDAQGNISSLKKSATDLTSEMSSQDGRLSKVEQTAKEHTSTISDLGKKVDSNGGGVNLLTNSQGPFRPTQKIFSATVYDNYDVYNSDVYMVQGQTYTVSGQTNGTWSGTHDTEHMSDNCVLWLTDNSNVSQIISADTMPHTFTWPYPTKSYHLRVNAYHHGADNPIYAEKVKIERGSVATPYSPAPEDLATVTQVKQTADGIETTLKNTQGDIDQIKQTAKGTSEQLSNVRGNVTTIQKDVDGLKQTTADNAGNIHTLQSDSKTLKDDMADAKGNISSLQKTSTSLVSEFKDQDGRISKTEQTASTLANEFSDQQGHLSRVEQTAQGTQQTVANQQGQINTIKTDVSGIHQMITGQGNQIATINVTLNGLNTKYEGVEKSGDELAKRLDNLKVGTSNLLHHSDTFDGWDKGNLVTITSDKYLNGTIAVLGNTGIAGGSQIDTHLDGPYDNQPVTWTVYAKADNVGDKLHTELWGGGGYTDQPLANNWQIYQFTGQRNINHPDFYLWGCQGNKGNIYVALPFAVVGNTIGTWSPNTDDVADKITTNSTQIDQNKKAIALKADQSTVNNLSGEVSQNKAQLKVQADQISSKVSSTEYQTLKDKVNNLQVGGDNLVSDGDADAYNATPWPNTHFQTHPFYYNSTRKMFNLNTSSKTELTADGPWFPVMAGHQYTLYFNGFMSNNVSSYDVWLLGKAADKDGGWTNSFNVIGGERLSPSRNCIITRTFTVPNDWNNFVAHLRFDNNGSTDGQDSVFFFNEISLKEGNVNTGYSASPNDAITLIKKNVTAIDQTNKAITLKADQAEVDNVKNTSQQLSSRLDVMADQIKSKVTSTDVNNIVDGKGYATTSTVQSLITQKAGTINESITNLDAKYRDINGVNLVHNSGFHNVTIDELKNSGWYINDGIWINKAGGPNKNGSIVLDYRNGTQGTTLDMTQTLQLEPDTDYTLSLHVLFAEMAAGKSFDAWTFFVEHDASGRNVNPYVDNGHPMANNYDRNQNTRTFHTTKNTHSGILYLRANPGTKVELEEVKLERGKVESNTAWTPAPSDNATVTQIQSITASIDGVQSNVTNLKNDTSSKITQLSNTIQSKVSSSDFNSKITQLANDINLRVTKGDLLSQINLTAGNTLIQSNKIYLDSSSVVFSGRAFIPSAAIAELDADKLTFYGNGSKASIGAGIAQYDQDAIKSTINLQYQGGFEIHSSNQLGSILTMHDNTVRLASRSQTYSSGSGKPLDQQYSGFWAGSNYALINAVDGEGKTTGWSIGPSNGNGYRAYLYDSSTSVQPNYGVGIGTQRFDVYAGGAGLYLGPDKAELRDKSYTTIHSDTEAFIEGGNEQIYIHDGEVCIGMPGHESDKTSVHLRVFGWADFNGWMNVMGLSQTSLLSTKTRIEPLDTRDALDKIMAANVETYQFKSDVAEGKTKRHASVIIDDVHDVSQYCTPKEFISENRKGRDDGDIVGYLMGAVQELKKQLDEMKKEVQING